MEVRPAAWVFTKNVAVAEAFLRDVLGFSGWTRTFDHTGEPCVMILERDGFENTVYRAANVSEEFVQRAVIRFLVDDLELFAEALDQRGIQYHWIADAGERPSITFEKPAELRAFALEQRCGPSTANAPPDDDPLTGV